MSGLTHKCRPGDTIQIGTAVVHIVRTGRKATINIVAPPEIKIHYTNNSNARSQSVPAAHRPTDNPPQ